MGASHGPDCRWPGRIVHLIEPQGLMWLVQVSLVRVMRAQVAANRCGVVKWRAGLRL